MIKYLCRTFIVFCLLAALGYWTRQGNPLPAGRAFAATDPWTKVSQPAPPPGQIAAGGTTQIESARSFAVLNGSLYVGTKKDNQAEVYRYEGTGTAWTKVSDAIPGTIVAGGTGSIDGVQTMAVLNNILYIGTQEINAAEVYSYDGSTWAKVSQEPGRIAVGGLTGIDRVQSMAVLDGTLYIGTLESNRAEVYRYDGAAAWTRVSWSPGRIDQGGTTKINGVDNLVVFNASLYAGTLEANKAEVYRYNSGVDWTKVSQPTPGQIAVGGTGSIDTVEAMEVHNGILYAGTNEPTKAEVYSFDGTTWTKVSQPAAGQIAAGGTTGIDTAQWLVEYNLNLYLGTGKINAGEVYRLNSGSDWTKVSQPTPGQIAAGGTLNINVAAVGAAVLNGLLFVGTDEFNRAEVYSYTDTPPP